MAKLKNRLFFLFFILGPFKKYAIFIFLIILFTSLTEALGIGIILPLVDIIVNSDNPTFGGIKWLKLFLDQFPIRFRMLIVCGSALGLMIIKNIFVLLNAYFSNSFINNLRRFWSSTIMENYMHLEFTLLQKQKQGVILHNIVQEPSFASKAIRDMLNFFAKSTITFFIFLLLMLASWKITLSISLTIAIFSLLIWRLTHNYSLTMGKKKIELSQEMNALATESVAGIRQIKIFSLENRMLSEFVNYLTRLIRLDIKFKFTQNLPTVFSEIVISTFLVGYFLFYYYIKGLTMTSVVPLAALFLVGSQRLFTSFTELFSERMLIISYIPSLKLVQGLVNQKVVKENFEKEENSCILNWDLLLRDVSFSYENRAMLFNRMNLKLKKGIITAIAGASGSGKSTLCDLIIGFIKPDAEKILVDGKDMHELDAYKWRRTVGYISQESFIFNTTIKENISLGKPGGASDAEIINVAKLAGAHEFIEMLPEKYDTAIGERGVNLSGGQRQRIAIARALVRNPKVIILDEATNSLDYKSEQHILSMLKSLSGDKMIIIITHRFSCMRIADYIYMLDSGKIVEEGNYEQLTRKKGIFWRLEELSRVKIKDPAAF